MFEQPSIRKADAVARQKDAGGKQFRCKSGDIKGINRNVTSAIENDRCRFTRRWLQLKRSPAECAFQIFRYLRRKCQATSFLSVPVPPQAQRLKVRTGILTEVLGPY